MEPRRIDIGDERLTPLFITPDSQSLFARPWSGGTLNVFSLLAEAAPEVVEDRDRAIFDAAIRAREQPGRDGGGHDLVVLLEGRLVKCVDLQTYRPVDVDLLGLEEQARTLVCSPDGTRMAIGYGSPKIGVFEFGTKQWQEMQMGELWKSWMNGPYRIWFSPDGRYVIAISDNLLAVWDDGGKLVMEVDAGGEGKGNRSLWTDMAVTPDSTKLIWLQNSNTGGDTAASCDYLVRIYDLARREVVKEWQFLKSGAAPRAVDVSPDGRRVIVAGWLQEFEDSVACEWSLNAPDGYIGRHTSFSKIADLQGLVRFARMAPDGSKIVVVTEELIPRSVENPQRHLFILRLPPEVTQTVKTLLTVR